LQGRLTEEQVREALSRAEELHLRAALEEGDNPAFESVLGAAEEMGIPRDAMLQALQEKLGKPMETPSVGQLVFARSADNNYYVAEVVEAQKGKVRVRFLSGGEDTLSEDALRPCKFVPGMKVTVQWPIWGWYKSDLVSYDEKKKKLLVSDGWQEKKFNISEVRLDAEKEKGHNARAKLYWTLITVGMALGGPIGALITWLLMR
jgi:hypothetical protein